jgi:hydrogenase nickel incorporation protein HypB
MSKRIEIVEDIMRANQVRAEEIKAQFDSQRVFAINVMASPGAGKTTLITRTVVALHDDVRMAYIDGDLETTLDADRIEVLGVPAVQINTGGACHLDANMIGLALPQVPLADIDLLIIENVGNLICPAEFDLGVHLNVLIASVPEGDDKPFKYPGTYRGVDVLLLNKMDLLPYISFNAERFKQGVKALNPDVVSFDLSCTTGEGLPAWTDWLKQQVKAFQRNTAT